MSKIFLRELLLSDIENVMTWVNDERLVKNFQNFDKVLTREEELVILEKLIASQNDKCFSIFRRNDGKYLGQGSINQISRKNKLGRLSLFLKPEFWGQKYAQEAVGLLVQHAFECLGLHKVWLMVWATNEKALHVYRGCGFEAEGTLREEYFWRGKHHDMVRMGKINKGE